MKLDVTLPGAAAGPRSSTTCPSVLPAGAGLWLFGHVADGNVHVNVTGVDPDRRVASTTPCSASSPSAAARSRAEHGIGRPRSRGSTSCARRPSWRHRAIKAALDPGILNPGVLLP